MVGWIADGDGAERRLKPAHARWFAKKTHAELDQCEGLITLHNSAVTLSAKYYNEFRLIARMLNLPVDHAWTESGLET